MDSRHHSCCSWHGRQPRPCTQRWGPGRRFWNTTSGVHVNAVDAGSQVCALAWSAAVNELVSCHGAGPSCFLPVLALFTGIMACGANHGHTNQRRGRTKPCAQRIGSCSALCHILSCQRESAAVLKAVHEPAGYSANAIGVWSYPGLQRIATLGGHTQRVLYLALSPDGRSIVSGAGATPFPFGAAKSSGLPLSACKEGGSPCALAHSGLRSCNAEVWPHKPRVSCTLQKRSGRAAVNKRRCCLPGEPIHSRGRAVPDALLSCCAGLGDETIRFWSVFPAPRVAGAASGLPTSMRARLR